MDVFLARSFRKRYAKLPARIREHADTRLALFCHDPLHPILDNHALSRNYAGCRSVNITGDYRAIYYPETETLVRFLTIGTHAEFYGK